MMTHTQAKSLGWMAVLAICLGLLVALSLRVHAVKSEVLLAERDIVSLERQNRMLETEFETRASQRQLSNWNTVEFGFEAPRADQYLDNERQLAALGEGLGPDAPNPIRVARAEMPVGEAAEEEARAMVSPISGAPVTLAAASGADDSAGAIFADAFGEFLAEASPIRAANARTSAENAAASIAGNALSAEYPRGRE